MRATALRGHHRVKAVFALLVALVSFLVVSATPAGAGSVPATRADPPTTLPVCGTEGSRESNVVSSGGGDEHRCVPECDLRGSRDVNLVWAKDGQESPECPEPTTTEPLATEPRTTEGPTTTIPQPAGEPKATKKSQSCETDGGRVIITLTNLAPLGAGSVSFVVTDPVTNTAGEPIVVEPEQSRDVVLGGLETGTYTVEVMADQKTTDTVSFTVACEVPFAAVGTLECTQGGINVNLENTGQSPTIEQVYKNGTLLTSAEVPPSGTGIVLVPMTGGETATVTVKSGDTTLAEKTITDNCATVGVIDPTGPTAPTDPGTAEVLGVTQTKTTNTTGPLPVTGSDSARLLFAGLVLVLAGTGLVVVTNRRRATNKGNQRSTE